MTAKRALVNFSVLSLQDNCVLYPCCKNCLSRLDGAHQSNSRCKCFKCGFTCDIQSVGYRYRLSLKVSRNSDILGVTVFGSCLNPFFGVAADHLQRFVDDSGRAKGSLNVNRLLIKAVEDCFVGRCFLFGIKVYGRLRESSLPGEQPTLLDFKKESGQFVASQITLPNEAVVGTTVISYLESLLQLASHADCSVSPGDVSLEQEKHTVPNSFEHTLLSCGRPYSQPSQETFPFPGPWQQSPGISLTPAEPEEHTLQERGRDVGNGTLWQGECERAHKTTLPWPDEDLPSQFKSPVVSKCDHSDHLQVSFQARISPSNDTCVLPSVASESISLRTRPVVCISLEHSYENLAPNVWQTQEITEGKQNTPGLEEVFLISQQNSSLALVDRPFSESLGEFVCREPRISEIITEDVSKPTKRKEANVRDATCDLGAHSSANLHWEKSGYAMPKFLQARRLSTEIDSFASDFQLAQSPHHSVLKPLRNVINLARRRNNERDSPSNVRTNKENKYRFDTLRLDPETPKTQNTSTSQKGEHKKKEISLSTSRPASPNALSVPKFPMYCKLPHSEEIDLSGVSPGISKYKRQHIDFQDEYNCSVDLFDSCQNSLNTQISDLAKEGNFGLNEMENKCCPDINILKSEHSDLLHFVPFSQSTPISKKHTSMQHFPTSTNHQKNSIGCRVLAEHHLRPYNINRKEQSVKEKKDLSPCYGDTEEVVPSSSKTPHSCVPRRTIGNKRQLHPYNCNRILQDNASRVLRDRGNNVSESSNLSKEVGQELKRQLHDYSDQKQGNCMKYENPGNEVVCITEVKRCNESIGDGSFCNSVICSINAESKGNDWSKDLFADSF